MPTPAASPATRAEMERFLRCGSARPVPPFLPAIYEYKASLIGASPTDIALDADLLARALIAEFNVIGADALTVGVDVYNVEAEAVGCRVVYPSRHDTTAVPGLEPGSHPCRPGDDLAEAPVPDPRTAGRMPVFLAAAAAVRRELGDRVWLRGAVSGPFSLAVSLAGLEDLFIACLEDPVWVRHLLDYCGRIIRAYAKGFLDAGVGLVVFDSQASPDLLSPALYEEFVLPATRDLVSWASEAGAGDVPLIVGGNTTAIAGHLIATGANNLLCDFAGDFGRWAEACRPARRALRRNVSPRLLATCTADAAYAAARREVEAGRGLPGFIMGTGVIPVGTPLANLHAIRQACLDGASG